MTKLTKKELEFGEKNKKYSGSYRMGKKTVHVYNIFLGGDGLQKAANYIMNGIK